MPSLQQEFFRSSRMDTFHEFIWDCNLLAAINSHEETRTKASVERKCKAYGLFAYCDEAWILEYGLASQRHDSWYRWNIHHPKSKGNHILRRTLKTEDEVNDSNTED